MAPPQSKAIWLNTDGSLTARTVQTPQSLHNGEALVRVLFSGVNPADGKHAGLGIFNTVAGYDFCGIVEEASDGCAYKVGECIAGYTPTGVDRPQHFGTHQDYIMYPADDLAFRVPKDMEREHAACLMVTARTAADALFNLLGYPLPTEPQKENLPPLLIWGGSSGLGLSV